MTIPRLHRGDAVELLLKRKDWTNKLLAEKVGVRPNTISDLINGNVESEPGTINGVCKELGIAVAELDAFVQQMNGELPPLVVTRTHDEREEDQDPVKDEARRNAKRIARLPLIARMAIYSLVATFEDAYKTK